MIKNILKKLSWVYCLFFVTGILHANSGLFFDVKSTGTPANVHIVLCLNGVGALTCQNYNVSALNLFLRTVTPNKSYINAGIKIITPGYTIAETGIHCTPYINGFCLFSASDTQTRFIPLQKQQVVSSFTVGGIVSGLVTNGLILQNNGGDNLAIPANATSFVFPTSLPSGSNYNVTILQQPTGSYCTVTNGSGVNVIANVTNVTVECHPSLAYFTNYSPNTVTICPIGALGELLPCDPPVNPDTTFNTPTGITLNQLRTKAYISNFDGDNISVCTLNANGSLTSCATQGTFINFDNPVAIGLNWTGTMAYISNSGGNNLAQCSIDGTGQLVLPCVNFSEGFANPHAIAINRTNTRLFVVNTNFNNPTAVTACDLDNTGLLIPASCQFSTPFGSGLVGIAINSQETKAYVTSFNSSLVYICDITAGLVNNCVDSGQAFNNPEYIALNNAGTRAYVSNYGSSSASVCEIDNLGGFSSCTTTGGIIEPYGVYVTN